MFDGFYSVTVLSHVSLILKIIVDYVYTDMTQNALQVTRIQDGAKNRANLSHCKYSENSMT